MDNDWQGIVNTVTNLDDHNLSLLYQVVVNECVKRAVPKIMEALKEQEEEKPKKNHLSLVVDNTDKGE
tara:strand:- start:46099 stop:46302 length:204 start_codon:yes stop_codon:yes gene_type:complete